MKNKHLISKKRIERIREQGYQAYTDEQISDWSFGNRFAYILCTSILTVGVITANLSILSAMLGVAFFGFVLPRHPFDYIYNNVLAERMHKPLLPKRSEQLKFACFCATIMIATVIYLFYNDFMTAGWIVGSVMLSVSTLVSTMDYCIPSMVYNRFIIGKRPNPFKNSINRI